MWLKPVIAIVAVEYVAALLIGAKIGFHFRIPIDIYPVVAATIVALTLIALLLYHLTRMLLAGEAHPSTKLADLVKKHRRWIIEFSLGALLVGLEIGILNWMKVMLPLVRPFWADPMLADLDVALLGQDAWRMAFALFGWAEWPITLSYNFWSLVKFATIFAVLCMRPSDFKSRAIVAYFLTIAVGCTTQYILPSGGPIFYHLLGLGDRFADLPINFMVAVSRDYLWTDYLRAGGNIGGGISAMPSLHVATSLWIALVVHSTRFRILGWLFYTSIFIGSMMLGWHYFTDSLAGSAIAWAAWRYGIPATRPIAYRAARA